MGELTDIDTAEYAIFDDMQGGGRVLPWVQVLVGGTVRVHSHRQVQRKEACEVGQAHYLVVKCGPNYRKGTGLRMADGKCFHCSGRRPIL